MELRGGGIATYLDVDGIVRAALTTGCDAVHPGYGFLNESPQLARISAEAGLVFAEPLSPDPKSLCGALPSLTVTGGTRTLPLNWPTVGSTRGDNGRFDEQNFLHYLGRRQEMIKVKEMSAFPAEIEMLLAQHPDVESAAVVTVDDPDSGSVLSHSSSCRTAPMPLKRTWSIGAEKTWRSTRCH